MTVETDFPRTSTTAWLSLRRGSSRWDLAPIAADWLNDEGELPLELWLENGLAEVIKTGPHRTVYRLTLPEGKYYLKEYKTPDWQAVLQNLVRPCKADLESSAARTIAELGLNTFETVAVGRRRQFGVVWENFLISREIPNAEPLDQFVLGTFSRLSAEKQLTARRSIARELGRIAALLHQNNLLHRDLHPGNLLIETQADFGKISLIDLHAMSRKPRLSPKEIARNLSLLNNFFYRLTSRTDRLRFLKSYLEHQNATASLRETARSFGQVCAAELAKADRRGDKKWQRGNRRLLILENAPNRCRGLAEVGKAQLKRFRDQPEQLFEKSHFVGWRKRTSGLREGLLELPVQGERRPAILAIRPQDGSARSAWEMGHALLRRRLPAPRPLFFVETKAGPWDYLVVEQIPRASSLKHWILEQKIRPGHRAPDEHRLNEVIEDVANLLKRLHDHGFHQPRLTLSSILIREECGERKLWLAGPETIQQPREIDARLVTQSLAAFLESIPAEIRITRAQCLRFLRGCLGGEFSRRWKSTWRAVAAVSRDAESKEAA